MSERNLPHYYWDEVVSTAVYIMNKIPIMTGLSVHDVTLGDKFSGRKPDLLHLWYLDVLLMHTF